MSFLKPAFQHFHQSCLVPLDPVCRALTVQQPVAISHEWMLPLSFLWPGMLHYEVAAPNSGLAQELLCHMALRSSLSLQLWESVALLLTTAIAGVVLK